MKSNEHLYQGGNAISTSNSELYVRCSAFGENEEISKKHTGFGDDISPEFCIGGSLDETKLLAIITDDLDIPFTKEYPHWLI